MTDTLQQQMQRADALYDADRLQDAEQVCIAILRAAPDHFDCLTLYGIITARLGRAAEARDLFSRAAQAHPRNPSAHNNLGNVLLGMSLAHEALQSYDRALEIDPNLTQAHNNRGNALSELHRFDESLTSYDRALSLKPEYPEALNNRGLVLEHFERLQEALQSYDRALSYHPSYADALFNRANLLRRLRRSDEALVAYDLTLKLRPDHAGAHHNRGIALQEVNRSTEALQSYSRALSLQPDSPWLYGSWLYARKSFCDWADLNSHLTALAARIQTGMKAIAPFQLLPLIDSAELQQRCAQLWMKDNFPPRRPASPFKSVSRKRVRLAYVSDDLREHALAYLMAGVWEQHDRNQFEVIAISFRSPSDTPLVQRLRAAFDEFIDVSQMSDQHVAQLIRDKEVDIAVDLMGATLGARPGVFAHRAAPIQVSYLGYPGTLGANYIDYLIADDFVIPPERRAFYSESVVYLPDCYQANDDRRTMAAESLSRRDLGLPDDAFVYCSFNSPYKLSPEIFAVWCRLLQSQSSSVLWLFPGSEVARSNLLSEARARNIDPQRIVFADWMPYERHLSRLQAADLFLDSLPFNAGATASDALWAGVPVLTCCGDSFAARMGGSLLRALELPELITYSLEEYERVGLRLAGDPGMLASLRARLVANRSVCALFDTRRCCRNLESAYLMMHARRLAGLPPAHLSLR